MKILAKPVGMICWFNDRGIYPIRLKILEEDGKITLNKIKDELFKRSINFLADISKKDNEEKVDIDKVNICDLERKIIDVPLIVLFNMAEHYNRSEAEKLIIQNFREDGYFAMGISIVKEDLKNESERIYINNNKNKQFSINEKAEILYRINSLYTYLLNKLL